MPPCRSCATSASEKFELGAVGYLRTWSVDAIARDVVETRRINEVLDISFRTGERAVHLALELESGSHDVGDGCTNGRLASSAVTNDAASTRSDFFPRL